MSDGKLMVSDTLGKARVVRKLDWMPRRFTWISDSAIGMLAVARFGRDSSLYRMSIIDMNHGLQHVIDRYKSTRDFMFVKGNRYYDGPWLTLEGKAYYTEYTFLGGRAVHGKVGTTARQLYFESDLRSPGISQHILRWGDDGLYRIRFDGTDSSLVAPKAASRAGTFSALSKDQTHIIDGGVLTRIADGNRIVLDTIPVQIPENSVGCGYVNVSFNPVAPEVLFQLTCDGKEIPARQQVTVSDRIGVFDHENHIFSLYDYPVGVKHCTMPVYSPKGDKVAFHADGSAYVMYRGRQT